jgi:hypothetical protein
MHAELDPDFVRLVARVAGFRPRAVHAVPSPTRAEGPRADAWAVAAERLAPGDVAVVPLDVNPGHHVLAAVREATDDLGPRLGLSGLDALRAVARIAVDAAAGADTAWHQALGELHDDVTEGCAGWADAFLARPRAATLTELVAEARAVGLAPIVDARLASSSLALLDPRVRAFAEEEARRRGDRWVAEQVADLVRNQIARLLVVVRGEAPHALTLDPEALDGCGVVATAPGWRSHALEPLDALAETALREADTPAEAALVVDRVHRSHGPVAIEALADVDPRRAGVLAAWELGLLRPVPA